MRKRLPIASAAVLILLAGFMLLFYPGFHRRQRESQPLAGVTINETAPAWVPLGESGPLISFTDLNNVYDLEVDDGTLIVTTSHSVIRFDPATNYWILAEFWPDAKSAPDYQEVTLELPSWYADWTAHEIMDACTGDDGCDYLMVGHYNDLSTISRIVIINLSDKKVYRFSSQDNHRIIEVMGGSIWLGHSDGITRIDLATGNKLEYFLLPKFDQVTGWVDNGRTRYIATTGGNLYALNLDNGMVEQLILPGASEQQYRLTNPIVADGQLFVGAMLQSEWYYCMGSVLWLYDLSTRQWRQMALPDDFGLVKLARSANEAVWCIGSWFESYDMEGFTEFGGVAVLANNRLVAIPELTGIPIGRFCFTENSVLFATNKKLEAYIWEELAQQGANEPPVGWNRNCAGRIDIEAMKLEEYLPVEQAHVNVEMVEEVKIELSPEELRALGLKVKPVMVAEKDGKAEIMDEEDFPEDMG